MKLSQYIIIALGALIVLSNALYPGGWILTLLIIFALLTLLAAYEFLPEYLLVTNQGKNARKDKRRKRRASGLNPFSRTSGRDNGGARDTNTSDGGPNNNE